MECDIKSEFQRFEEFGRKLTVLCQMFDFGISSKLRNCIRKMRATESMSNDPSRQWPID